MAQKFASIDLKAAKQAYDNASQTATNYISADSNGIKIASSNPSTATTYQLQTATSTEFVVGGNSQVFIGTESNIAIARIGKLDAGNIVLSGGGYVDVRNSTTILAHFGYESGNSSTSSFLIAPYFTFGNRKIDETNYPKVGSYSVAEGNQNIAAGYCSHSSGSNCISSGRYSFAQGSGCVASGDYSIALGSSSQATGNYSFAVSGGTASVNTAMALGNGSVASGPYSIAMGSSCTSSGIASFACGVSSTASADYGVAIGNSCVTSAGFSIGDHIDTSTYGGTSIGRYNREVQNNLFTVGYGTQFTNGRLNMLTLLNTGHLYINGTSSSNGTEITSDARIKTLISLLSPEEGLEFIRNLKPKKYYKNGKKELGFYAQDVETDETFGDYLVSIDNSGLYDLPDYRMLNYQGIIAPLVAAVQKLDKKIDYILQKGKSND